MNRSLLNHLATFSLPILLYSLDFGFTKDKRTFSNPEFYSFTSQLLFQLNFLLLAVTLQSFLIELNQWQTVNLWQVVAFYLRVSWVLFHKGRLWLWNAINCRLNNNKWSKKQQVLLTRTLLRNLNPKEKTSHYRWLVYFQLLLTRHQTSLLVVQPVFPNSKTVNLTKRLKF